MERPLDRRERSHSRGGRLPLFPPRRRPHGHPARGGEDEERPGLPARRAVLRRRRRCELQRARRLVLRSAGQADAADRPLDRLLGRRGDRVTSFASTDGERSRAMRRGKRSLTLPLVVWLALPAIAAQGELAHEFRVPPARARPHTWWHWMNGNV